MRFWNLEFFFVVEAAGQVVDGFVILCVDCIDCRKKVCITTTGELYNVVF